MNDRKALKAVKRIKKYCNTTACDLCIFNLSDNNGCYFMDCTRPHAWDVLSIESNELDKRDQEIWGGEGD